MGQQLLLKLNHISKSFKSKVALKDINMQVHRGEILGFLGPSGSGKTTTIRIVTGQLRQSSGDAQILEADTRKINNCIYKRIGIVTDSSGVYKEFSVYENLKLFADLLAVDKKEVDIILDRVGLTEHKKTPAGKLSKGQTQRLVLARAVLHKPELLFLDEPTSGLDPSTALEIHNLLRELRDEGMGIFLTTHNMEEATKLCDNIALLNDGVIVEFGTPQEICFRYNTNKKYRVLLKDNKELVLEQNPENTGLIREWMDSDKLESIHSCEPTLETVFLTVTGRSLQ